MTSNPGTSYPGTPYPGGAVAAQPMPVPAPVSRPGTLVAAMAVAVVSALAGIVSGVLYLTGGEELERDITARTLASVSGESADAIKAAGGALFEYGVKEVHGVLQARMVMAVVLGALLLLFGLLVRGGAMWARVLVTLCALANAGIALRIATDAEAGTGAIRGIAWLAVAAAVASIVAVWLPANGRYAKARKANARAAYAG
ncbi:hypothetical protein [Amycolatopsis sp. CA-230715]|uniref:hypothetical protein n=1 Tax=Amycolatopsis sp. CA-230715 TaxID=2745196 RepID=UPI001C00AAA6|nr:hypothetical protein [Amycolatopsis sp. CA-230715]QWF82229.1 hypothetical protein HUW46_05666 [Amycolatopsis sp. CA-230715]